MSAVADLHHEQNSANAPDGLQQSSVDHIQLEHDPSNDASLNSVRSKGLNGELANRWLAWQCKMIADVVTGCVFDPQGNILASRPESGLGTNILTQAAIEARRNNRASISTEVPFGPSNGRLGDIIATPIKDGDTTLAIVALLMTPRPQSRQNVVLQLLQWGGFWLESLRQLSNGVQQDAGSFTQSLFSAVLQHSNSHKACMEVASTLADRLGCDRVAIGMRKGVLVRTECISHLANFDPRTQMVRRLEAAMEEALDQEQIVCVPTLPNTELAIDKAHRDVSSHNNNSSVATFPMAGQTKSFGAVVLERDSRKPFDNDTLHWCESVLSALGPVIELKKLEERPFSYKLAQAVRNTMGDLFGAKYLKLKIAALVAGGIVLLGSLVNGNHQVSAPASIEGAISQVIAAPIAGFIKSSDVRAGDTVVSGQRLATLDDRSLQLELKKWQSEENKIKKAYQEALAKRARTELSILRAKADQIDAELSLVNERIERTELRAPYSGYIASGDLSQSLGAPVETGDVLFEVAPLEGHRVVIEVDEEDMAGIERNKNGEVVLAALPSDPLAFTINQVVPVAISGEGNSYFRVEATLQNDTTQLRPGMEGVARVDMGERKLIWIWTHKLFDRIRLWMWSLGW